MKEIAVDLATGATACIALAMIWYSVARIDTRLLQPAPSRAHRNPARVKVPSRPRREAVWK